MSVLQHRDTTMRQQLKQRTAALDATIAEASDASLLLRDTAATLTNGGGGGIGGIGGDGGGGGLVTTITRVDKATADIVKAGLTPVPTLSAQLELLRTCHYSSYPFRYAHAKR